MGWVGSGHTKWTHGQLCFIDSNMSVFSLLRTLTTWHCPHSPRQHVSAAERWQCNNRSIYFARRTNSSKPAADRRTGRQTDGRTPYSYIDPCSIYYAGSAENVAGKNVTKREKCEKIKTLKSVINVYHLSSVNVK